MKKAGKLIAGVLVVGVLGCSYVLLKNHNEKAGQEESAEEEKTEILSVSSDEIKQIAFSLDDGDVIFEKKEDAWENQVDPDFPLDEGKMTDITNQLSSVKAERTLEDVEDLQEYGLDNPQKEIQIVDKNDGETVIYVGNLNESTDQYYLQVNDEKDKVYLVSQSVITPFTGELYDFAVSGSLPTISSTDVSEISVEKENPYVLKASTEVSSGWLVGEDEKSMETADSSKTYSLISSIGTLSYDKFIDYHCENMDEYGLEKPFAVLSVDYTETETSSADSEETEDSSGDNSETNEEQEKTVEKQFVLNIGDACGDSRYVNVDGTKEVYTITQDSLASILDSEMKDFYNMTMSYVPIAHLKQLVVTDQGTEVTIDAVEEKVEEISESEEDSESSEISDTDQEEDSSQEDETEIVYYIGDEKLDSLEFKTFYSSAINQAAQSRYEDEYKADTDADLKLQFILDDGTSSEIAYYPYDSNFYIAVCNDGRMYLANKMNIKQLIEMWENLYKGE